MVGEQVHQSVEEVEAAWQTWANRHGLTTRRRAGDMSTDLRESRKTVRAYASGGKWIADCPNCNGGIACWSENPRGCCLDCGTIYKVSFHPDSERAAELLARREVEAQQTWIPDRETIEDLERENAELAKARILQGVVAADRIKDVLGEKAVEKLVKAGVL